jgi:hypothetical protein
MFKVFSVALPVVAKAGTAGNGGLMPPQFFREQVLPGEALFLTRADGGLAPCLAELDVHPLELVFEVADLGRVRLVLALCGINGKRL